MDMFGAGLKWTVRFMVFGQAVIFLAGVWAAWNFFEASEPVTQLRWGLPAAVLLLGSTAVKLAVGPAVFPQPGYDRAQADRAATGARGSLAAAPNEKGGPAGPPFSCPVFPKLLAFRELEAAAGLGRGRISCARPRGCRG